MPEKKDKDIVAHEWHDVFMGHLRKRMMGTNKLPIAYCVIAVDPDDKSLNATVDILGDKSGPMPETDRAAIVQVFHEFKKTVKKIFGAEDVDPIQAWGHLK